MACAWPVGNSVSLIWLSVNQGFLAEKEAGRPKPDLSPTCQVHRRKTPHRCSLHHMDPYAATHAPAVIGSQPSYPGRGEQLSYVKLAVVSNRASTIGMSLWVVGGGMVVGS
jgi:hypothetical protein